MACIFFMKLTVIQPDIRWEKHRENYKHLGNLISESAGNTDLIVLPEMFPTGFSMNTAVLAEGDESSTVSWMEEIAAKINTAVCGSYIASVAGKYFNRFIFIAPGSEPVRYDKKHLFRMGKENLSFSAGTDRVIFSYKEFRILPVICYDLRFPVWLRNRNDYDLIICVANWPDTRTKVWNTLLRARAIENQCYVAASNRIGSDGEGIYYSGDSVILDPKGNELATIQSHREGSASAVIDLRNLNEFREKFPVWKDADDFIIT